TCGILTRETSHTFGEGGSLCFDDWSHVEVTSRLPTPPLMTRCNKSTQAYSSHLELGKRLLEQPPFLPNKKLAIQPKPPTQPTHTIVLFVPEHHPLLKSGMCRFILQPVKNVNK
ncbi:hypothetical protein TNCT_207841, partial [Trichonephila clavata]